MAKTSKRAAGGGRTPHEIDLEASSLKNNTDKSNTAAAAAADNHNHLANSGDRLANESETNSTSKQQTSCFKTLLKWFLILMAVIFTIIFVTFIILSFGTDNQHNDKLQTQQFNFPFQLSQNNYKLLATKTLYNVAYNFLILPTQAPLKINPSSSLLAKSTDDSQILLLLQQNQHSSQTAMSETTEIKPDKRSLIRSELFSRANSLESLNTYLTQQQNCKAKQLHFFGRHAARLPNKDEINFINKHMSDLANLIGRVISKHQEQERQQSSSTQASSAAGSPIEINVSAQQQQQQDDTNNGSSLPWRQYTNWTPLASEEQDNLITEMGAQETHALAERYRSMFPHFFDGSKSDLKVSVTDKLRTAQTAVEFFRSVVGPNPINTICHMDQFPSPSSDLDKSNDILSNRCLQNVNKEFLNNNLMFHKTCENERILEQTIDKGLNLDERIVSLADAISKRLKMDSLNEPDKPATTSVARISLYHIKALYDVCRYETSLGRQSIWCDLFDEKELEFYEFLKDVDDYTQVRGDQIQTQQTCAALRPVKGQLKQNKQLAHFYFTHSEALQRMIVASTDLNDRYLSLKEPNLLKDFLARGRDPPRDRIWRTSLLTPFSANLAFILYECPNNQTNTENSPDNESMVPYYRDFWNDHVRSNLKLVAALNEQPVFMSGCDKLACDLPLALESDMYGGKTCELEKICSKRVTIK